MKLDPLKVTPVADRSVPYRKIAVLGSGAWGTALAALARRSGRDLALWGRDADVAREIVETATNSRYLGDVALPAGIQATTDIAEAVAGADAVLVVVPSHAVRDTCARMAPHLRPGVPVAVCAKGIERNTGLMMTQVAEDVLDPRPVGVVSGPTFAREAVLGHPTAATVAFPFGPADRLSPAQSPAARLAVSLSTEAFRTSVSDDVAGVEIGGAIKNVIAIACGMMTGAGFAENTRAALITQGVDEMRRLSEAMGGRPETVTGLAGLGDLSLTCSSATSRNMSLGLQLGGGTERARCFDGKPVVVEGELNSKTVTDLARRLHIPLPICEAVRAILHDGADLGESFARLWARPLEAEPQAMTMMIDHPATDTAIRELAERIA
ncbi:MAG: NAD(P)-dependent glycerol-3-phosphate dehydrogenase [Rhodobacteraceae bacterium]|nr:NAD(P)-dependent glycerol-3-phosphate dehydrogenase [Paracoccaceae bacterium]